MLNDSREELRLDEVLDFWTFGLLVIDVEDIPRVKHVTFC